MESNWEQEILRTKTGKPKCCHDESTFNATIYVGLFSRIYKPIISVDLKDPPVPSIVDKTDTTITIKIGQVMDPIVR